METCATAESVAARFTRAQAHWNLPARDRENNPEGATDWIWLVELCLKVVADAVQKARRSRKRTEEDLIDEVWVHLSSTLRNGKCKPDFGGFAAWLADDVDRILHRFAHRPRREPAVPLDRKIEVAAPDESIALERTALGEELRAALDHYRSELTPTNCDLIRLYWLEGLRLKDAAAKLGLTEDAAEGRQRRAFAKLRILLPGHPEWPLLREWIESHSKKIRRKPQNPRRISSSERPYIL